MTETLTAPLAPDQKAVQELLTHPEVVEVQAIGKEGVIADVNNIDAKPLAAPTSDYQDGRFVTQHLVGVIEDGARTYGLVNATEQDDNGLRSTLLLTAFAHNEQPAREITRFVDGTPQQPIDAEHNGPVRFQMAYNADPRDGRVKLAIRPDAEMQHEADARLKLFGGAGAIQGNADLMVYTGAIQSAEDAIASTEPVLSGDPSLWAVDARALHVYANEG